MKFLSIASLLTLSSSALAAIRQVQLFAQSDNEEINTFGLSSIHEGAGINYFFLAAPGTAQTLQFDDETNNIFAELGSTPPARQYFVISGNILQLSVAGEPLNVQIADDGLVSFPGSESIAAAKNINDPYRYSEEQFAVVTNGAEGSIPFKIVAKFVDENQKKLKVLLLLPSQKVHLLFQLQKVHLLLQLKKLLLFHHPKKLLLTTTRLPLLFTPLTAQNQLL